MGAETDSEADVETSVSSIADLELGRTRRRLPDVCSRDGGASFTGVMRAPTGDVDWLVLASAVGGRCVVGWPPSATQTQPAVRTTPPQVPQRISAAGLRWLESRRRLHSEISGTACMAMRPLVSSEHSEGREEEEDWEDEEDEAVAE